MVVEREQQPVRIAINIRNDYVFKRIFAYPGNERLLVVLINSILSARLPRPIVSVLVKNPLRERTNPSDKQVIYDIRAQDDLGNEYIVEMQNRGGESFMNRFLYYTSAALVTQIGPGLAYDQLRPTYGIAINDFFIRPQIVTPLIHMYLMAEGHPESVSDLINLSCLQLPALRPSIAECTSDFDRICYTFSNNIDLHTRNPGDFPKGYLTQEMQMILDTLKTIDYNAEERAAYEADLKYQRDLAMLKRDSVKEGRVEGIVEGKQNTLLQVLGLRFGTPDAALGEKIKAITDERRIDQLVEQAIKCQSLAEFAQELG